MFATVLGVIITNCYMGYKLENNVMNSDLEVEMDDFQLFLGKLSYQMIHNTLNSTSRALTARNASSEEVCFLNPTILFAHSHLVLT